VSAELAFLSPTATSGAPLRTPMDGAHVAAGARIEERDGWRIGVYPGKDAPVWVADVSQIGKVELRGADAGDVANGDTVLRLTPRRTLVLCAPGATAERLGALGPAALDVTCVYAAVRIGGGPLVRDLFRRVSALDIRSRSFPDGAAMMGSIARCPGIVVNEGGDRFLLMAGWEYGAYLWQTILDAGDPLGIAPRTEAAP
jgi:sarcosine oxidase gamma subunit